MCIAILMATYNGEKYIKEQMDSIINQSYKDWKLYINDDGSTDTTIQIIRKYMKRFPDKIYLDRNQSGGHGSLDNFADLFDKVPEEKWYAFCDQDDVWPNDRLENMMKKVSEANKFDLENTPMLVYGKAIVVDKDLKQLDEGLSEYMYNVSVYAGQKARVFLTGGIWGCSMLFNHALRIKICHYPKTAVLHDEYLSIICTYFGKKIYCEKPVVLYRQHSNNASVGVRSFLKDVIMRLSNYKGLLERMRIWRYQHILQIEGFYSDYKEEITEEAKKEIEKLIRILTFKSRIHSLYTAYKEGYAFYKGSARFYFLMFCIKQRPKYYMK